MQAPLLATLLSLLLLPFNVKSAFFSWHYNRHRCHSMSHDSSSHCCHLLVMLLPSQLPWLFYLSRYTYTSSPHLHRFLFLLLLFLLPSPPLLLSSSSSATTSSSSSSSSTVSPSFLFLLSSSTHPSSSFLSFSPKCWYGPVYWHMVHQYWSVCTSLIDHRNRFSTRNSYLWLHYRDCKIHCDLKFTLHTRRRNGILEQYQDLLPMVHLQISEQENLLAETTLPL